MIMDDNMGTNCSGMGGDDSGTMTPPSAPGGKCEGGECDGKKEEGTSCTGAAPAGDAM